MKGNVAWHAFQIVAWGWGGNERIRIGQGIQVQPFSAYLEPREVVSQHLFNFGGLPLGSLLFFVLYPYSPSVTVLCTPRYLTLVVIDRLGLCR